MISAAWSEEGDVEEPQNQARTGVSVVRLCRLTSCRDVPRLYLYDALTSTSTIVVLKLLEEPCWRRADGAMVEES